jgi:hypothetical protein
VSTSSRSGVDARESARAPSSGTPDPSAVHASEAAAGSSSGWPLRGVALLLLMASIVGRALAPALRGSRAGIGRFIDRAELAGEILTQLAVFAAAMVAVRLAFAALRDRRFGVVFRSTCVPMTATIVTLVIASSAQQLELGFALTLGLLAALLAFAASVPSIKAVPTRAAGFVLALAATATLAHLVAGVLAVRASERALVGMFSVARAIASVGFVLDVASVLVAAFWIAARRWVSAAAIGVLLFGGALLLAWGAGRGSAYDAPLWQVLAARVLAQVTPQPPPLFGPVFRYAAETLALLTAAVTLFSRSRPGPLAAAVALAILARASTEVPALGLSLALAALIAAAAAADARGAPRPGEA